MIRLNYLYSHHYVRDFHRMVVKHLFPYMNILIDSGAFSDYTSRLYALRVGKAHKPIKVEDYAAAIEEIYQYAWGYFTLDVIGDTIASRENFDYLLERGYRPIPIVHARDDAETIRYYFSHAPDNIIAVGGIAGKTPTATDLYAAKRFDYVYRLCNNKARIHALGYLQLPEIFKMPVAFSDSSTFSSGARYGKFIVFHPQRYFLNMSLNDLNVLQRRPKHRQYLISYMLNCGITYDDLIAGARNDFRGIGINVFLSAHSYMLFLEYAAERGLHFFPAASTPYLSTVIFSVISARIDGTPYFDYRHALREYRILENWRKEGDYVRYVTRIAEILSTKTNWQVDQTRQVGRTV